jgi:hypothetical protein
MHTAKINLDRSRGAFGKLYINSCDAKIKSRGFLILKSREVNITFQRLLWNDQNSSLWTLKA